MSAQTERDQTLDVFRGIAILMVVLFHFTARIPPGALGVTGEPAWPVFFGWVGVYFFFAISGYCIFLTLDRSATVRLFLARRFSRIYPAFLAAALFLFAYGLIAVIPSAPDAAYRAAEPGPLDLVLSLLLVGELGEWVNGSFWSIAVEVKFYLIIAVMAFAVPNKVRLVTLFSLLAVAMGIVWALVSFAGYAYLGSPNAEKLLAFLTIAPYLPFFAIGILGRMRTQQRMSTTALLALNLVVATLVVYLKAADGLTEPSLAPLVTAGVFLLTMWLFQRFVDRRPIPVLPVISPALAQIGFLSYTWYLIHENLGMSFMLTLNQYVPAWISVLVATAATYVIAYVFAQAFEWRFRKPVEKLALFVLDGFVAVGSRLRPQSPRLSR